MKHLMVPLSVLILAGCAAAPKKNAPSTQPVLIDNSMLLPDGNDVSAATQPLRDPMPAAVRAAFVRDFPRATILDWAMNKSADGSEHYEIEFWNGDDAAVRPTVTYDAAGNRTAYSTRGRKR